MDDLIAFLKARLNEREAALQRLATLKHNEALSHMEISVHTEMSVLADIGTWPQSMPPYEADAWRMLLADIASKRQIIELAERASNLDSEPDGTKSAHGRDWVADPYVGDLILRQLALPFAAPPDYRAEWRQ